MTADSFKHLIETARTMGANGWFKFGARLFMWIVVPLIGTLLTVALALRADVGSNREYSEARAKDAEAFQAQVLANDTNTKAQLELLRTAQRDQGLVIANMSGVLTEMQRQQTAMRNARPFIPTQ